MANLTTEISAVNLILGTVGQAPVGSLDDSRADVRIAQNILAVVSRTVQSEGWNFNTEYNVQLTRNGSNELQIASNVISVDFNKGSTTEARGVIRGDKLYDTVNHTFTWGNDPKVEIKYLLNFTDLPETARHYIATRAARDYQQKFLGSGELQQFSQQDELMARANMLRHEAATGDYTIFDGTGIRNHRRNNRFSK